VVASAVVSAVVLARAIPPPPLGKCSAGVASAATTQQGRGAGAVSPMAMTYSTPAWTLTFSKVLGTSQGHSVSSLSQSQST
jgi:hypothetical protein